MKRSKIFATLLLLQMIWGIPVALFSQSYEQCLNQYTDFTEWEKIPMGKEKSNEITKCFTDVPGTYNPLFKRIHDQAQVLKRNYVTLKAIKDSIANAVASNPAFKGLSDNLDDVIGENNECSKDNFHQKKAMLALVLARKIQLELTSQKPKKSGTNQFARLQKLAETNKEGIRKNKNSLEQKGDANLVFLLLGFVFLLILLHAVQWVYFQNKLKKNASPSSANEELHATQITNKITALEKRLDSVEKQGKKKPESASNTSSTPKTKKSRKAAAKANRKEQTNSKTTEPQQKAVPVLPDAPRFYSPPPDQGLFFGSRLVDSPRPNEHVYVIHMINESEGEYEIRTDQETLQYAFNMMNSLVNPAAKLINAPGKINIGQESFRQVRGRIKREHKNWKIVKKLEIIFDKR